MANGFCPYLLQHIKSVHKSASPQLKIRPNGYSRMLLQAMTPGVVKNDSYNGHFKSIQVKAKQRFNTVHVATTPSCDQVNQQGWVEESVSVNLFRQFALHLEDETVAAYCEDASKTVKLGNPATDFMMEMVDSIYSAADAVLMAVDQDLLNVQASAFGVNFATGSAAAQTINLPKDGTKNPLTNGITKVMSDFKRNGGTGRPQVVGAGLMLNFILNTFGQSAANQAGIDGRLQAGMFDFYYDENVESIWGANRFGVFEKDSVQLVEYLKNQGFKAGVKPGASVFGIMPFPVEMANGEVATMWFDYQLRYNDCEQTFYDAYYGSTLTLQKGYNIILSKQFGLKTIGTAAYRATDYNKGNRGSYLYVATNDCDAC